MDIFPASMKKFFLATVDVNLKVFDEFLCQQKIALENTVRFIQYVTHFIRYRLFFFSGRWEVQYTVYHKYASVYEQAAQ